MAPSEINALIVWAFFRDGLPLNSELMLHLGEQGCAAAGLSKSELSEVFDTSATTRKFDCILGVAGLQVGNMEAKRARASKQDVALQLRKPLKINKSIMLEMDWMPSLVEHPRLSALVFRIVQHEGIWLAGKTCNAIALPSTAAEFQLFIQRSAHTLFRLLDEYDTYAKQVVSAKEAHDYEQRANEQEEYTALDQPSVSQTLEWNRVVLHTPSKPPPTKAQQVALLQRTQQGMQGHNYENEGERSHSPSL
ncbi:hypothetical protein EDD21DRAFT_411783 [Dissophora ornata]|nr:hypothetical protein EDD21DRAFT_411783 [Dissophora ornata]